MSDAPATTSSSIWDDFIDIWTSPSAVFTRRSDGKWGHAMLFLIALSAIIFFGTMGATEPLREAEMARSMAARSQEMTAEQMEAARSMGGAMVGVFVIVGTPIVLLLLGVAVWLSTRIVGGAISFAQGLVIACFAMFPRLVEGVTTAAQAMVMDDSALNGRFAVSFGPGRFLDPDTTSAALLGLIGRVDLFTLWVTVLVMIGIKVIGKRPTDQAAMAAAIVWLLGALPTVVPALFQG